MKFPKNAKIEKCASRDISRAHLVNPYLDVKGSRLVATDGHAMAIVTVEVGSDDHDGPVTSEALQAARKAIPKHGGDMAEINVNGSQAIPGGATFPRPAAVSFPPVDAVIPTYGEDAIRISFNPWLLLRAVEAIGADSKIEAPIVLTFASKPDKNGERCDPMRVDCDGAAGYAVVMPCRVGGRRK